MMENNMSSFNTILTEYQVDFDVKSPICILKPARFKAFVRLMQQLVKINGPRPIYIRNSRLIQPIGHVNFWVDIDLGNILTRDGTTEKSPPAKDGSSDEGVSFGFQATESALRELHSMAGKMPVAIYDRGDGLAFVGAHTQAQLLKPAQPTLSLVANLPTDKQRIGEDVSHIDLGDLKSYAAKTKFIALLCYEGQLEQIVARGKRPYTLYQLTSEALKNRTPELVFTSQGFLALAGELELSLGIYRNGLGYWLKTSSRPSMINNLTTYERLYVGRI